MLLKEIIEFKNGKKKPSSKGSIPIYGGNGILGYADQNNQNGESLIIGRVGAYCGCVYSHYGKCWISDNAIVGKVNDGNDFYYCYYLLKRLNLNSRHVGSGQPLMTQEILNNIEINICDYETQRKIGKILKNIDDKIRINNKINNNLYELMKIKFNNYIDNLEEYEESVLSKIANYKNGLAMQKFRPIDEIGLPVIKIKEMNSGITSETERCRSDIDKDVIIDNGDILFAWSGTLCMSIWCEGRAGLNQHIFKVTSDKYPKWFYYLWTLKHLDNFIEIAAGKATTMGHIKRTELDKAIVKIPDEKVMEKMDKIFTPMLNEYVNNSVESNNLSELRDTLLPKLMDGEIDLDNIEI